MASAMTSRQVSGNYLGIYRTITPRNPDPAKEASKESPKPKPAELLKDVLEVLKRKKRPQT